MPPRTRPQTVYASKSMFICGPFYPAGPLSARLPVGSDAVSAAPAHAPRPFRYPGPHPFVLRVTIGRHQRALPGGVPDRTGPAATGWYSQAIAGVGAEG